MVVILVNNHESLFNIKEITTELDWEGKIYFSIKFFNGKILNIFPDAILKIIG
jgi:hypothetical protein